MALIWNGCFRILRGFHLVIIENLLQGGTNLKMGVGIGDSMGDRPHNVMHSMRTASATGRITQFVTRAEKGGILKYDVIHMQISCHITVLPGFFWL